MKTRLCLERHSNEILIKLKIFNKKTQEQQNQDFNNRQLLNMIPGGDAWYVADNGQLRPQQHSFKLPVVVSTHPSNSTISSTDLFPQPHIKLILRQHMVEHKPHDPQSAFLIPSINLHKVSINLHMASISLLDSQGRCCTPRYWRPSFLLQQLC